MKIRLSQLSVCIIGMIIVGMPVVRTYAAPTTTLYAQPSAEMKDLIRSQLTLSGGANSLTPDQLEALVHQLALQAIEQHIDPQQIAWRPEVMGATNTSSMAPLAQMCVIRIFGVCVGLSEIIVGAVMLAGLIGLVILLHFRARTTIITTQ